MPHRIVARNKYTVGLAVTACVVLPSLRNVLFPHYKPKHKLKQKTILVTGATGNVARLTSRLLAKHKQRVIMASRNMKECMAARREIVFKTGNNSVLCRNLDLSSMQSIEEFVANLKHSETRLDVIINVAATTGADEKTLTKDGVEEVFSSNYLGHFYLTNLLLDILDQTASVTKDCRIINVTGRPQKEWSIDRNDLNFDKREYSPKLAFAQSKFALAQFTYLLDKKFASEKKSIFVSAADFGPFRVAKFTEDRNLTWAQYLHVLYDGITKLPAERAAFSLAWMALDPSLGDRKNSGRRVGAFQRIFGWPSAVIDDEDAMRTWNSSVRLIEDIVKFNPRVVFKNT